MRSAVVIAACVCGGGRLGDNGVWGGCLSSVHVPYCYAFHVPLCMEDHATAPIKTAIPKNINFYSQHIHTIHYYPLPLSSPSPLSPQPPPTFNVFTLRPSSSYAPMRSCGGYWYSRAPYQSEGSPSDA